MKSMVLSTGKIPHELLRSLLQRYSRSHERLLVGPAVGEDATAIALEERVVVAGMDPITFATDEIGWYVVHVNANDVAVMGAVPRWFLVTLLLPEGQAKEEDVERIFHQIAQACEEVGALLVGGHTEVSYDLSRPLAVGVMLGEVHPDRLISTAGAQPGDALSLARGVPIEGTAIIARERREELLRLGVSPDLLARAADYLHTPGISVVKTAMLALETAQVHAMHDPTEGGLLMGIWELAEAAGVGVEVNLDDVPVVPEGQFLCEVYGLDPMGTIASGALLIACEPADAPALITTLEEHGIPARIIGHITSPEEGRWIFRNGQQRPLTPPAVDEIVKIFES